MAGRPARCRDWSGGRDHLKWLQLRKLQSEEREQRRAGRRGAAPPRQLITGRATSRQPGAPHALRPQSKPDAEPGPELWPLPLAILGCGGNTESAASSRHVREKEREEERERDPGNVQAPPPQPTFASHPLALLASLLSYTTSLLLLPQCNTAVQLEIQFNWL